MLSPFPFPNCTLGSHTPCCMLYSAYLILQLPCSPLFPQSTHPVLSYAYFILHTQICIPDPLPTMFSHPSLKLLKLNSIPLRCALFSVPHGLLTKFSLLFSIVVPFSLQCPISTPYNPFTKFSPPLSSLHSPFAYFFLLTLFFIYNHLAWSLIHSPHSPSVKILHS